MGEDPKMSYQNRLDTSSTCLDLEKHKIKLRNATNLATGYTSTFYKYIGRKIPNPTFRETEMPAVRMFIERLENLSLLGFSATSEALEFVFVQLRKYDDSKRNLYAVRIFLTVVQCAGVSC